MRWQLGRADSDVNYHLKCCLSRSLLIYIGNPIVAAGVWKRQKIDPIEASLYRYDYGGKQEGFEQGHTEHN